MNPDDVLNIIKKELAPAMGCTEPVAIALTAAHAFNLVKGKAEKISLKVSSNVYKNAKAVGIPGTVHTGVEMAAFLGICIGKPVYDLTILSSLIEKDVKKALRLQEIVPIEVQVLYDCPNVHIEVEVVTDKGSSRVLTSGNHTNIVFMQRENEIILDKQDGEKIAEGENSLTKYTLDELIEKVLSLPPSSLEFLLEGIALNMTMAEAGLKMDGGMNIGKSWRNLSAKGLLGSDVSHDISYYTAAACDARMNGVQLPVMSSAGSGNHGLVATIPIARAAEHLKSSKEEVLMALAVSHLVTFYIKQYTGRLSPVCGCGVAAGAGASSGLAFLLAGSMEDIERAIVNVVSSLSGMICDGGKVGCALKLFAIAGMAWQCALLAREGVRVPAGNGIVASNLRDTLINLGRVSQEGMSQVDKTVISVMES